MPTAYFCLLIFSHMSFLAAAAALFAVSRPVFVFVFGKLFAILSTPSIWTYYFTLFSSLFFGVENMFAVLFYTHFLFDCDLAASGT